MPNFGNPVLYVIGMVCVWLVAMSPFAFICRRLTRPDGFSQLEALVMGLLGGPLGIYLVNKENNKAARKASLQAEHEAAVQRGEVEEEWKDPERPTQGVHGGGAFRLKRDLSPTAKRVEMLTTGAAAEEPTRSGVKGRPMDERPFGAPPLAGSKAFRPPRKQSPWPETEEE